MIRRLKSPPKGDADKDKPICREIEKAPEDQSRSPSKRNGSPPYLITPTGLLDQRCPDGACYNISLSTWHQADIFLYQGHAVF